MAKVLERTRGVDLEQARRAAADAPDDVAAQTLVADWDLDGLAVTIRVARAE